LTRIFFLFISSYFKGCRGEERDHRLKKFVGGSSTWRMNRPDPPGLTRYYWYLCLATCSLQATLILGMRTVTIALY